MEPARSARIRTFLERLRGADGGYADAPGASPGLQPTVAALKALAALGFVPDDPDATQAFVMSRYDAGTGGFVETGDAEASVFGTGMALIALQDLGARSAVAELRGPGLRFMAAHARAMEEHFIVLGVHEECRAPGAPPTSAVAFFRRLEDAEGSFGTSVLTTGIAASGLLRVHEPLVASSRVIQTLLAGQRDEGGFSDPGAPTSLWTTYCVMRALDRLDRLPRVEPLVAWLERRRRSDGFAAAPGGSATASATYQALSVLDWCVAPVLRASARGDVAWLDRFRNDGGDPNRANSLGWTPLLTAAARGRGAAVERLLATDPAGTPAADPGRRLASADASATFLCAQSGDRDTLRALLRRQPEAMYDVCLVNGGTLLLQAAFYGSGRHHALARSLLEDLGSFLALDPADDAALVAARKRLFVATNVRGFNAVGMARLFHNEAMAELLAPYDESTADERAAYLEALLRRIAVPPPETEPARAAQAASEQLLALAEESLRRMQTLATASPTDPAAIATLHRETLARARELVSQPALEVDRRAGPLGMPPLVGVLTDGGTAPPVRQLRYDLARVLLEAGADPRATERHPMGVGAVIRAAVLGHFDLLQLLAEFMKPLAFAAELNRVPPINGQTALQDSVHRTLTAPDDTLEAHLAQIRWAVHRGARLDLEDNAGLTPERLARDARHDPIFGARAERVLEALGLSHPGGDA